MSEDRPRDTPVMGLAVAPLAPAASSAHAIPEAPQTGPLSAPLSAQPISAPQRTQPPGARTGFTHDGLLAIGSVLTSRRGTYQVTSLLGAGEFGAVFECVGPFDQAYAVKMIRPANRAYADVHAEWTRETQRLLTLRHPNVVYIHDAFAEDALLFLALERCDHSLRSMLGAPLEESFVLELARQICAAVQFLHDNDVVHDDLHPGNVLITRATDRPVVKLSDFGISHELRGAATVRPNVVHHAIMAPEVVSWGYTSKQSDIYQIGLLLYWMLTGTPALDPRLPYQELVRQVADGAPRRCAESLGTPLGQLVAKMLRRREAFRYASAREVWEELRLLPAWQNRRFFPLR